MTAGQPTSPADVESINALVRGAPMWRELRGQRRLRAVPEHGGPPVVAALAEIAQGAVDLLTGAEVQRCHAPRCILFFVKTHPRQEWCSDACGNRMRAARHYARVRQRRMAAET
jgi:predicted RNA-binding Zn ribbon-like protein